jgi:hypothetical protein
LDGLQLQKVGGLLAIANLDKASFAVLFCRDDLLDELTSTIRRHDSHTALVTTRSQIAFLMLELVHNKNQIYQG